MGIFSGICVFCLFPADSLFSYLMGVCWVLPPLSVLSLDLFVGVTSLSFVQPGGSRSINNNNHPLKWILAKVVVWCRGPSCSWGFACLFSLWIMGRWLVDDSLLGCNSPCSAVLAGADSVSLVCLVAAWFSPSVGPCACSETPTASGKGKK